MSTAMPSLDIIMDQLDAYMRKMVQQELSGKIMTMTEYHLGWCDSQFHPVAEGNMGKRGRPMLVLLISMLFSSDTERIFPVATAVEFVHNFSLIFDDIQDKDTLRRGRPAVWSLWGEDEAINVGCALQTLASLAMSEMAEYFPRDIVYDTQKYLSRIMLRLCHGQQMDVAMTKTRELISIKQYLSMISGKTAALFEGAAYLGALCAGAPVSQQQLCRDFGHLIGMSFQLFDDAMGIWGSEAFGLDKPSLDLEKRKKTYPILHAYNALQGRERRDLLSIYDSEEPMLGSLAEKIREKLTCTEALERTLEAGYHYLDLAFETMAQINGQQEAKQAIIDWVQFVTQKQIQSTNGHVVRV